ncbi:undecaprenyl-phosphate glucose phosphotransferase [Rivibacter subsaxonicus]|uniref:Putative colanic acid biosynthesis UDP-glucose lipid carrier transferase n=1 Tax=Rivibacter subsaxonicus TaxID=457575 RepID=A0A4V2FUJ2_9BURK|nr:undecaprenyl-phosphate glucose phosphotransferase [Rivibacter subsaxonicus]RZU02276.1 putative colanic acid biosynthesis UDP-glucose lipid carrier transferase [Rivibacter subsaxonicus]
MFEHREYKRTFYSAPQSVRSLVAAFIEPGIIAATLLLVTQALDPPVGRTELVLCLLAFALTFPGRNRFSDAPLAAGVDILLSWISLLAILVLCGYATRSLHLFDTEVILQWALLTPLLLWLAVMLGRTIIRAQARSPYRRRTAVVVGGGSLGVKVARALEAQRDEGIDFIGYFDDRTDDRLDEAAHPHRLGGLGDVGAYVGSHSVREVYVTLPLGSQPRIQALLQSLQDTTASLFFVPDVFGISIIQGRLQDMAGVPVVGICETPFTGTNELVKRMSDFVLSCLILVLITPVLIAVAIGVKLSSPGPVIFKQRRYGLDGEEIIVYKFRSMTVTEDGATQYTQVTKQDARVTPFGAFIRRTSLDELPQFINVLQGRMSIVGPRPHAIAVNEHYRQIISAYMVRHKVKPGITGWAQINGFRGGDDLDHMKGRIEYDLEYLRNWSLGLDLQIIARTAWLVLFDRHAF